MPEFDDETANYVERFNVAQPRSRIERLSDERPPVRIEPESEAQFETPTIKVQLVRVTKMIPKFGSAPEAQLYDPATKAKEPEDVSSILSNPTKALVDRVSIRAYAGLVYAANPDWKVSDMRTFDTRLADIPVETLRSWALEDEWEKLRDQQNQKILKRIKKQFGDIAYERRMREIAIMEAHSDQLDGILQNREAPLRSHEGVMKVRIEAGRRVSELLQETEAVTATPTGDDPLAGMELDAEDKEALTEFLLARQQMKSQKYFPPADARAAEDE